MATVLDIGILENFSIVFVFLLIFVIIFAIMEKMSIFGKDKKGINALIAMCIGFIIIIFKPAVLLINIMTPWFLVFFLFLFFLLFALRMFGISDSDTLSIIKDDRVYPYIVVIAIVIVIGALASTFGQSLLEDGSGVTPDTITVDENGNVYPDIIDDGSQVRSTKTVSFGDNVLNTLIHPKVLGFIAIMLIGLFTIVFMTRPG
jgi:hypothetical protein